MIFKVMCPLKFHKFLPPGFEVVFQILISKGLSSEQANFPKILEIRNFPSMSHLYHRVVQSLPGIIETRSVIIDISHVDFKILL